MTPHLLTRRQTHFVLWRPGATNPPPKLFIGPIPTNTVNPYQNFREIPLTPNPEFPELWEVPASQCQLADGQVYYYWFKVRNTNPYSPDSAKEILYATDPFATTVDRRPSCAPPAPSDPGGIASGDPASVILYRGGQLIPGDPPGKTAAWTTPHPIPTLPANNRLVIYELPTRWTKIDNADKLGHGTFRDTVTLIHPEAESPGFGHIETLGSGNAHLIELGINAVELLPPADSPDILGWGYGTALYLAPDFDLGFPSGQDLPTASSDLAHLVDMCHQSGIRFFVDVVMAFCKENPYRRINFLDFFIYWNHGDPEQGDRDGFGGELIKYNLWVEGYHPITGKKERFVPGREYMKVYIAHWLEYYRADGLRLDSVNNVANYDFLQEFKDFARAQWKEQGGLDDRFIVVGEELSVPLALVHQNRLDGLWNERFKQYIRHAILGNSAPDDNFEWTIRKIIDCRNFGFSDGTQAVNYLTSHDVGGYGNDRLQNYLVECGVVETEQRVKLAFVCLLTAVGIPMILAGDEFADQHDLDISDDSTGYKQVDPVNYERAQEDWRQRIFQYVARLVKLRTTSDALAVNDTDFIHSDFSDGKRVMVWKRGTGNNLVVVVANFSDYGTPDPGNNQYVVSNWPATPGGYTWREVTQDRPVTDDWIGREPIFPWEAKVYTLVPV